MAVPGHFLFGFLIAMLVPDLSVTLLLKLTMLSDGLWGAFGCFGSSIETVPIFSHSIGFMTFLLVTILSLLNAALLLCGRAPIPLRHCIAMTAAAASHPLLDFLYHPAFWWPGWFGLGVYPVIGDWQLWASGTRYYSFGFWVDLLMGFLPYLVWRNQRSAGALLHRVLTLEIVMWSLSAFFCMAPVYSSNAPIPPVLNKWIQMHILFFVPCANWYWWWTPWSWAVVLIPMHYIDKALRENEESSSSSSSSSDDDNYKKVML